jgi:hypothetical protein
MNRYFRVIPVISFVVLLSILCSCTPGTKNSTSTTPLPTGPQSSPLLDGNISVTAETNLDNAFVVTANMKNVTVAGYFECFGGAPNHIELYLMDDATYKKFLQKPGVPNILFDSQLMTSAEIPNVAITTPGTYHLVFRNISPATLSPAQQVKTTIVLNWTYY